jgi:hypothetical protein
MVTGNTLQESFFEKRPIFDKVNLSSCELSIQLMPDGFSFLIQQEEHNKIVAIGKINKSSNDELLIDLLKDFWKKEPILNRKYRGTRFIYCSIHSIWTPKDMFDHEHISELFDFNIEKESTQVIRNTYFPEQEAYLSYSVDEEIQEFVKFNFPYAEQLHVMEVILPMAYALKHPEKKAILYSNGAFMDICILEGKKLIFHKTYIVTNDEERAYYTFFSLKQLKFSFQEMPLYLMGDFSEECVQYFDKYIRHVHICRQERFSEKELKKIPEKEFYPLLNS